MSLFKKTLVLRTTISEKLKNLRMDERFSDIFSGSIWALSGQVIATVLGMVTSVIIARYYGAEMLGILAVIQALIMFTSIFTVMGMNVSILRLIPEHVAKYSITSAFKVYRKTQYLVGTVSIVGSVLLFLSAEFIAERVFFKPHLSFYFVLVACVVVFRSLMILNTEAARGLGLIKSFMFLLVLPPAAMIIVLVTLTIFDGGPNSPVYSQMLAWGTTAIVGAWVVDYFFRKRMRSGDLVELLSCRELLRISSPMMVSASMTFVIGQTGVILLGIFRPEVEVGYYAMAVKLATLTSFILGAVNSIAAPKFSELFHREEMNELFYVAKKSSRLIFYATVPVLLVLVAYGKQILSFLFGQEFTAAYVAMVLLVIGQFISAMAGSTGYFMNMTGNQKRYRNILLQAGLINVVLSTLLIPKFGIVGAAFSGMLCLIFWNIRTLVYIKIKYGQSIGYVPMLGKRS
jgi:O-antigen/teichoic acid export membrane protein